ncbi:MAG: hypothetical protein HRU11_12155 [Parvularculaceae bacterium]|nr:hypothetical protein [Parvularculaceae bacterium]
MSATNPMGQGWHLDKRVPLALIVTIFLQSCAAVWWAAQVDGRVEENSQDIQSALDAQNRVMLLEQSYEYQNATLDRLEKKIDRLDQRLDELPD